MHHPWRRFRDQWGHVGLEWRQLDGDFQALTDGRRVLMDPDLLQVERRCAIAHETAHLERGEHCAQDHAVERRADRIAASRLVSIDALMQALIWSDDLQEVADELWVTPEIARARIDIMRPAELTIVAELIADLRA